VFLVIHALSPCAFWIDVCVEESGGMLLNDHNEEGSFGTTPCPLTGNGDMCYSLGYLLLINQKGSTHVCKMFDNPVSSKTVEIKSC